VTGGPAAPPARRAFIGLGSNLGDRRALLRAAVERLRRQGDVVGVSPLYETEPVGGPEGQGPYLNVVVELSTRDTPRRLLERCRALEEAAGRVRSLRWGPRTLDADVLWVEGCTVDEHDLTVPHPRLWERRFVVQPLADLAPDLVTPEQLDSSGGDVVRVGSL
jgi:2-amino-4-hydroxy-6-hydroxymethyldihydropteridine diphosphokinase